MATLYNTYWIRFPRAATSYESAVQNSATLFTAARRAGVRRIVHVSIANPSPRSPYPYFSGKAAVEQALKDSGVSYAIVRPTIVFGPGDVLINNVAWLLRRFPIFAIPGSGQYPVRPVHVADVAHLCVTSANTQNNTIIEAAGPQTLKFTDLVTTIREAVGSHTLLVRLPPTAALNLARAAGTLVCDTILTRDELGGLIDGLASSQGRQTGTTSFTQWVNNNSPTLGQTYHSEIKRHYSPP